MRKHLIILFTILCFVGYSQKPFIHPGNTFRGVFNSVLLNLTNPKDTLYRLEYHNDTLYLNNLSIFVGAGGFDTTGLALAQKSWVTNYFEKKITGGTASQHFWNNLKQFVKVDYDSLLNKPTIPSPITIVNIFDSASGIKTVIDTAHGTSLDPSCNGLVIKIGSDYWSHSPTYRTATIWVKDSSQNLTIKDTVLHSAVYYTITSIVTRTKDSVLVTTQDLHSIAGCKWILQDSPDPASWTQEPNDTLDPTHVENNVKAKSFTSTGDMTIKGDLNPSYNVRFLGHEGTIQAWAKNGYGALTFRPATGDLYLLSNDTLINNDTIGVFNMLVMNSNIQKSYFQIQTVDMKNNPTEWLTQHQWSFDTNAFYPESWTNPSWKPDIGRAGHPIGTLHYTALDPPVSGGDTSTWSVGSNIQTSKTDTAAANIVKTNLIWGGANTYLSILPANYDFQSWADATHEVGIEGANPGYLPMPSNEFFIRTPGGVHILRGDTSSFYPLKNNVPEIQDNISLGTTFFPWSRIFVNSITQTTATGDTILIWNPLTKEFQYKIANFLSQSDTANQVRVHYFDNAGDLLVGTGNNTYQKLAKGSNQQVLKIWSGLLGWHNDSVNANYWQRNGTTVSPATSTDGVQAKKITVGDSLSMGLNGEIKFGGSPGHVYIGQQGYQVDIEPALNTKGIAQVGTLDAQSIIECYSGIIYDDGLPKLSGTADSCCVIDRSNNNAISYKKLPSGGLSQIFGKSPITIGGTDTVTMPAATGGNDGYMTEAQVNTLSTASGNATTAFNWVDNATSNHLLSAGTFTVTVTGNGSFPQTIPTIDTTTAGTGLVNKTRMSHLSSYPTLNQNTTGTAGGLSGTALAGDVTNSGNTITAQPKVWCSITAAYTGATTCTLSGTQLLADQINGSLFQWESSGNLPRMGIAALASYSGGTITVTAYGNNAMASGDKNYYFAPNLKSEMFAKRITIPGSQVADATNPQGMWFQGNATDSLYIVDVSAWVLTAAAGSGAALTYAIYAGASQICAPSDLTTNTTSLDNIPTTPLITKSLNLTLRILTSAGATNVASNFQCRFYAIPSRIFYER